MEVVSPHPRSTAFEGKMVNISANEVRKNDMCVGLVLRLRNVCVESDLGPQSLCVRQSSRPLTQADLMNPKTGTRPASGSIHARVDVVTL